MALTIRNKELIRKFLESDKFPYLESRVIERINKMTFDYEINCILFYEDLKFIVSYNLLRSKEKALEELIDNAIEPDTNNRTSAEIRRMCNLATESIRHRVSALLMDTSEENPLETYICLEEGAMGLSTLQMPHIISMYQEPSEGTIWVKYEGCGGYDIFDNILLYDQLHILEELEEQLNQKL